MNDYLIHSGKLGMKWYHHDKDAYQTKSGNWVYGRTKPSESWNLKTVKTVSKITGADDILDDAVKINLVGKSAKYSPSRNQNCISCAIAYDLRRAGNKVQAIETAELISPFVVADIYKKTKITDYVISAKRFGTGKSSTIGMTDSEFDNMVNHLKSDGENTRGIMTVDWKYKHSAWYGVDDYVGCHAMNYEVKNGKFYLIDGQLGKVYDEQNARKLLSNTHDVMTLRTDNRRVNLDYAKSYFVEPEGTKITAPSKDLHTAEVVGKISKGLYKASPVATAASIGLLAIHPALFVGGLLTSTAMGIGGNAVRTKFSYKAQEIVHNNKDKTAAKIIEKLTGDKVDPKTLSTTVVKAMRSLPEYKRVYQMESGGEYIDYRKLLSELKTTDNNAVNNTPNRNRAPIPIPVASPTGKNTSVGITSSQKGSMKSLYAKGIPIDEIAERLGVSPSTVSKYVK